LFRTIITGWRRALTNEDIWAIRDEDSTQQIFPGFERNWEKEKKKAVHKFSSPLVSCFLYVIKVVVVIES